MKLKAWHCNECPYRRDCPSNRVECGGKPAEFTGAAAVAEAEAVLRAATAARKGEQGRC